MSILEAANTAKLNRPIHIARMIMVASSRFKAASYILDRIYTIASKNGEQTSSVLYYFLLYVAGVSSSTDIS
jgi:hypothetical protein